MAFPADDRLAELTEQEKRTLARLETSRQELAELREQIHTTAKMLRRQRSRVAVEQYELECRVGQAERQLTVRSQRLVRLWRLFKKRIRTDRSALAAEATTKSDTIDQRMRRLNETKARLDMREAQLLRREHQLEKRSRSLRQQAQRLSMAGDETAQQERQVEELRTEIAGLELRARHLRETQPVLNEVLPIPAPVAEVSIDASAFIDLRHRLLEHWSGLLSACSAWAERQHDAAQLLADNEQRLLDHAGVIAQTMTTVTARQWALERTEEAAGMRERRLTQRAAALAELYERWSSRLRAEQETLTDERRVTQSARERWLEMQAIDMRMRRELHDRECSVAARELAVERLRQEVIEQADNPATMARRLERLRRQWWSAHSADEAEFARTAENVERRLTELQKREQRLTERAAQAERSITQRMEQLAILERRMIAGGTSELANADVISSDKSMPARAA